MKVDLLKNLIKEAVREVIREELQTTNLKEVQSKSFKTNTILPEGPSQVKTIPTSINEALKLTKASMTREEFDNIIGTDSVVTETQTPVNTTGGGLDLSNLDFVKKAAAIYNLGNTKR
jgi:2,3-bisphosphoglycerate-independent phosphoglycerate mutase